MENKKNNEFSSIDFIIFEQKNTALATAKCMEFQENSSKNETISLSSIETCRISGKCLKYENIATPTI